MPISNELLDELLKGCKRPEDLLGDAGLMKELKIRLMERMLGAVGDREHHPAAVPVDVGPLQQALVAVFGQVVGGRRRRAHEGRGKRVDLPGPELGWHGGGKVQFRARIAGSRRRDRCSAQQRCNGHAGKEVQRVAPRRKDHALRSSGKNLPSKPSVAITSTSATEKSTMPEKP